MQLFRVGSLSRVHVASTTTLRTLGLFSAPCFDRCFWPRTVEHLGGEQNLYHDEDERREQGREANVLWAGEQDGPDGLMMMRRHESACEVVGMMMEAE